MKTILSRFGAYAVLALFAFIALFPILNIVTVSLRPSDQLLQRSLARIPEGAALDNGPELYFQLIDGLTAALTDFDRLLGYANTDRDSLDWQDATQRVASGQAAFTVMGDWALMAFGEPGATPPEHIVWSPVPGTDATFDLVIDAFTLPVGAEHPEAARSWLTTVASAQGQTVFSNAKGSLPARSDLGAATLGTYQRAALDSFSTDTVVPSLTHGAAVSAATLEAVTAAVADLGASGGDVATLQAALAAALA